MRSSSSAFLLVFVLQAQSAFGQHAPLCDVTCGPDPSSSTYSPGSFQARPGSQNVRGQGNALAVRATGSPPIAPTVAGSQSAFYAIPILHLPGRNGLDIDLTLYYSSRVWTIDKVNNTATFNADRDFPSYGFRLNFGYLEGPSGSTTIDYIWTEPDGSKHYINSSGGSQDASFVSYDATSRTLRTKNGTAWVFEAAPGTTTILRPIKIEDTNGNFISVVYSTAAGADSQAISTITDTVGRTINFNYDASNRLTSITAPAFGGTGTTTVATFTWSTATLKYSFSGLSVADTLANNSSINVITQCRYANGAGYNFIYGDWGIVKEIDHVSSNGTLRSSVSWNFPLGTTAQSDAPAYSQQTVFDGVNTGTWTYSVTKTAGLVSAVAVTDPSGTVTTTNLITQISGEIGLTTSVTTANSAGTVLRTTSINWLTGDGTSNPPVNPLPSQVWSTLSDSGQQSEVTYAYDSFGNVIRLQEFDYGLSLLRTTQTDYLNTSAYTTFTVHILDRPVQVRVYNGTVASANLVARTDYAYDASGSLTSVTGAQHHDDTSYGGSFTTRGNLTSTTRYPNLPSTSTTIVRNFTYDTLGNLLTAQLDCCNQEQWTYASADQYAYPTLIVRGPSGTQLSTSRTYDLNTGLLTAATDENNQTTAFAYDSMKRLTTTTRPDNAQITTSFDDNSAFPAVTTTSPVDTGKSVVAITTTDGLGRATKQETRDAGGTSYSIIDAQYDALGRVLQVSNPHTSGQSDVWTVNNYDSLSRIVKVIPPDGTSSSNNTQFTYSGNNTVVTDPAGKQRRTYTDAFGRVTQAHEPGYTDGANATGSFTISAASGVKSVNHLIVYNSGTVSLTVGNYTAMVGFDYDPSTGGINDCASCMAAALAGALNSDANSPVTATASNTTVSLVARFPGPQGNMAFSLTSTSDDPTDFPNPPFTASPASSTMSGGQDGSGNNGQPPSLATPLVTVYSYDSLDNLTKVFQGQQQRLYSYDSTSRLLSATTPEAGTVTYTYNDSSTVATRTDARGVITTYSYDGLNRLHQLSYTTTGTTAASTASVTYTYGTSASSFNNGRLSTMSDGVGGEAYGYDQLGRMISLTKTIGATSFPLAYSYNLASELTQITYPSGRAVAQSFDNIGRLSQITSSSVNYLTVPVSTGYNAASEVLSATYGNGVAATFTYNSRLQLASLAYAKGSSTLFSLTYGYALGTANNGQIQSITDNVDNGRTANYTYDAWSRLKTAATAGSANYAPWGLSWSYDRYGNRKQQSVTAGSGPSNSVTPSATTNRLLDAGYSYDLAGNMTADGLNTLGYDAENRVTSNTQSGAASAYVYDGNSLRVEKTVSGATNLYIFSGSKVIAEYASGAAASSPSKEYIYSGSQLLATIAGSTTSYHIADHLSPRLTTDTSANVIGQQGHYPFGEQWYAQNTTTKWQFTSYERDPESGNDYAMMRMSVNRLGRFSSLDPFAGALADPQSLNRYTYVLNDPANLADPSGEHPAPLQNGDDWLGGGGGGSCTIDGFTADCGSANALLAGDFAVQLPPGLSQSGSINGQLYFLTATSDEDGNYLDYNYFGLSAAQIETLGLPTEIDLGYNGGGAGSTGKIRQMILDALKNDKCAALLDNLTHATRLAKGFNIFDVKNSAPPTDPTDFAAWQFTSSNSAASTAPFSRTGNIYVNINFWDVKTGTQATIVFHELRHQEYGSLGEPAWGTKAYADFIKNEYALINQNCFTQSKPK